MSSTELFRLNFHPSSLLTIGDVLAFTRSLGGQGESLGSGATAAGSTQARGSDKAPSFAEQLALGGSVMSRVPQRCDRVLHDLSFLSAQCVRLC
jgi:hypothetical protein